LLIATKSIVPVVTREKNVEIIKYRKPKTKSFLIGQTVISHLSGISGDSDRKFVNALIRAPSQQTIFALEVSKKMSRSGVTITGLRGDALLDQYWNGNGLQNFEFHPIAISGMQQTVHPIRL
jgi:hypothetical protein